jgi:hypothetical protein
MICISINKVAYTKWDVNNANKVYIDHMGISFRIRYKNHLHDIRCSKEILNMQNPHHR